MIMQRSRELDEQEVRPLPHEQPEPDPAPAARQPLPGSPVVIPRTRVQLVRSMAEDRVRQAIWLTVGVIDAIVVTGPRSLVHLIWPPSAGPAK
jgi:hypothetical protein